MPPGVVAKYPSNGEIPMTFARTRPKPAQTTIMTMINVKASGNIRASSLSDFGVKRNPAWLPMTAKAIPVKTVGGGATHGTGITAAAADTNMGPRSAPAGNLKRRPSGAPRTAQTPTNAKSINHG
ncbi:hypothetical protein BLIN101_03324 [Brevibacterium linens]|uniref:Uncharacterized protein n=1 Tax=Brevibacterium linens TaxID=1703 RepID=A0A2H1KGX8_BRELN|nr:hypothetical protein BLIN101_03324 [Brevibacterium linens]